MEFLRPQSAIPPPMAAKFPVRVQLTRVLALAPPPVPQEFRSTLLLINTASVAPPPFAPERLARSRLERIVPPLAPPPESFAAQAVMTQFDTSAAGSQRTPPPVCSHNGSPA